ncbi:PREDICTED: progressive rod-cone degeneration protein-like [Nipponia nippon]|uniref:progressive rod-cone degeneration protein-like n=1 Tax=Nipponia nippon TaxID=128390 RepID=UPI0005119FD1|nr:PREDICTED: progressive rod-cone degeneration protein-like [Nipponia nippon]
MCTTLLLLGTLVMMLRRRFFNKVEPYVLSCPLPVPSGPRGREAPLCPAASTKHIPASAHAETPGKTTRDTDPHADGPTPRQLGGHQG